MLGAVLLLAAPLPAPASHSAAHRGAQYLVDHPIEDAPHRVAETLVAVVAGGITGPPVARAVSAMTAAGPSAAKRAGEAGLLVMGLVAAGHDPRDYVERLRTFYDARIGMYDMQQFQNALALLGVVAAGERIPEQALTFLRVNRCPDGGIPVQVPCGGAGGHVDVTALVLQALVAHGLPPSDPLRADARSFLVAAQNDEGGFGDKARGTTNANSTGLALAAFVALGGTPRRDPRPVLLALQQSDGRFHQDASSEGDSHMATRQVVPGLAGRPYPVQPNPAPTAAAGTTTTTNATPTTAPTMASVARVATTTTTSSAVSVTPTTLPTVLGRNGAPEGALSAQSRAAGGGRRRPTALAAIASALWLAVAWRGARLPRPRRDHPAAARGGRGDAPVPDG